MFDPKHCKEKTEKMLKSQCVMLSTRKKQAGQKSGSDSDLPFLCHTDTYKQVCSSILHPPVSAAAPGC